MREAKIAAFFQFSVFKDKPSTRWKNNQSAESDRSDVTFIYTVREEKLFVFVP